MSEKVEKQLAVVKGRARPLKFKGRNGVYHAGYAIEFRNPFQNIYEEVDYIGGRLLEKGDELEVTPPNHQEPLIVKLTKVDGALNDNDIRIHKARKINEPGLLK